MTWTKKIEAPQGARLSMESLRDADFAHPFDPSPFLRLSHGLRKVDWNAVDRGAEEYAAKGKTSFRDRGNSEAQRFLTPPHAFDETTPLGRGIALLQKLHEFAGGGGASDRQEYQLSAEDCQTLHDAEEAFLTVSAEAQHNTLRELDGIARRNRTADAFEEEKAAMAEYAFSFKACDAMRAIGESKFGIKEPGKDYNFPRENPFYVVRSLMIPRALHERVWHSDDPDGIFFDKSAPPLDVAVGDALREDIAAWYARWNAVRPALEPLLKGAWISDGVMQDSPDDEDQDFRRMDELARQKTWTQQDMRDVYEKLQANITNGVAGFVASLASHGIGDLVGKYHNSSANSCSQERFDTLLQLGEATHELIDLGREGALLARRLREETLLPALAADCGQNR